MLIDVPIKSPLFYNMCKNVCGTCAQDTNVQEVLNIFRNAWYGTYGMVPHGGDGELVEDGEVPLNTYVFSIWLQVENTTMLAMFPKTQIP